MKVTTIDGRRYAGETATEIACQMWRDDHGRTCDLDAYMTRVAIENHLAIVGADTAARAESFLAECSRVGLILLVLENS